MTVSSTSMRLLIGGALLGAIATVGVLVPTSAAIDAAASVATDPVRFAFVVAGLYLVRPFVALPPTPLAAVVGYGYGIQFGVPIALTGVVVTVLPVFSIARWVVDDGEASDLPTSSWGRVGRMLEKTERVVHRYYETAGPIRGVTASRLAPIPSDVSTCAAAVSGVRLRHLVVGTALGELPWTVAAVVVGASAATVTADGIGTGVSLAVACGIAAVLLLAGPAYRTLWPKLRTDDSTRPIEG